MVIYPSVNIKSNNTWTNYNLTKSRHILHLKIVGYHRGNKISVKGPSVWQPVQCTPQSLPLTP